jgi:hypothetical protein
MQRLFFVPFAFFVLLWGFGSFSSKKNDQVAEQIARLEEEKLGYEGRALKHEYYAEYLQFNDKTTLEYRRHLQLAEENRMKAAYLQKRIDELKAQRNR